MASASDELIGKIKKYAVLKTFSSGRIIFSEGETAESLPIVISGRVKMIQFLESGKDVIIGIFEEGDVFAIPPVFDGAPYPASAVAMEKSKLLLLSRKDFLRILNESGELSVAVIGWMCGMLREKTATIQNLATASPEFRVANVLRRICDREQKKMPLKITLRRQDIAEMAGLTTETTIRTVKKLEEKGLFRIVRGKIIFDEIDSLKHFLAGDNQ